MFKYGENVQMSAYKDYTVLFDVMYLMKLPNGLHLGWNGYNHVQFKYCRHRVKNIFGFYK
jgi:hypothetical protein